MTDYVNEEGKASDSTAQQATNANQDNAASTQVDLSKYLPKEEATRIISDQRKAAYEKGYSTAQQESEKSKPAVQDDAKTSQTGKDIDVDEVVNRRIKEYEDKLAREANEAQKRKDDEHQKQQVSKMVNELTPKVEEAQQDYPDFDEVTSNVQFEEFPGVILAANSVDNSGHIFYELAKHPTKLVALDILISKGNHRAAMAEIKKLSTSIKGNFTGGKKKAPAPLDTVRSSNIGDNGQSLSIADRKKIYTA